MSSYTFRPMTEGDLPLVREWLMRPHVAEWWADGEDFEFVSGDLGHHDLAQLIVLLDDTPVAYLQCYRLGDWHVNFGAHPDGTRGLDQFISEADLLSKGHGSAFIRQFIEEMFADGTPRFVIDPSPGNLRAIRAYEKPGFVRQREIDTPDGRALLMTMDRPS
jgi:aminoglycoside 6'-N-acetyltransferase